MEQPKCGNTHTHTVTQPQKKEILPFPTTCIEVEGIMLSEIGQRTTYTVWSYFYVESKKQKPNS